MLRRLLALGVVGVGMASGAVHNIMVGASDHKFRPDSVMAAVGDVICESSRADAARLVAK